jgi:hypothetical protein
MTAAAATFAATGRPTAAISRQPRPAAGKTTAAGNSPVMTAAPETRRQHRQPRSQHRGRRAATQPARMPPASK